MHMTFFAVTDRIIPMLEMLIILNIYTYYWVRFDKGVVGVKGVHLFHNILCRRGDVGVLY